IVGEGGGDIRVWDLAGRQDCKRLPGSRAAIAQLACSPDGAYLAASDEQHKLRLWRLPDFRPEPLVTIVHAWAWSSPQRRLVGARFEPLESQFSGVAFRVILRDLLQEREICSLGYCGHDGQSLSPRRFVPSPCGQML